MVNLFINDIQVEVPQKTTILQACDTVGIDIPRFCFHERLLVAGNCRMCLVLIVKSPKPVIEGMKSYTKTSLVNYNSIFTSAVRKKKSNVRFFHSTSVCLMRRAGRQIIENAGHSVPELVPKGSCSFIPGISSHVLQNSPKCPFLMEHQLPPKYSFSNYPIDLENLNTDGKSSSSSEDSSGGDHSSSNSEEA